MFFPCSKVKIHILHVFLPLTRKRTSLQKVQNEKNVEHNHLESLKSKATFRTEFDFLQ